MLFSSKYFFIQAHLRALIKDLISIILRPPFLKSLIMACLFILPSLPLQRKSRKRSFNSFKIWSFDWCEDKRWITWETTRLDFRFLFVLSLMKNCLNFSKIFIVLQEKSIKFPITTPSRVEVQTYFE